jgi:hypothetical protein
MSLIHEVARLDLSGATPGDICDRLDISPQMHAFLTKNDGYQLVKEQVNGTDDEGRNEGGLRPNGNLGER